MSALRYWHNRVAASNLLLLVAILLSLLLWLPQDILEVRNAVGFAVCLVSTVLMLELNNSNVLLRIRSRMVSAVFVVLWAACAFLQPFQWAHVAALCLILAYHSLFSAYQQTDTPANAFNAFLCIGVCTVVIPQLVVLAVPFLWAFVWFQALSLRSFCAMFLGLLAPFWMVGSYAYLSESLPMLLEHMQAGWAWSPAYYLSLSVEQMGMAVLVLVFDVIAIIHMAQYSFQDKIRTRVLFYFMAWMTLPCVLLIAVFPQHFNIMLALFLVNSSPLIAHYFALATGKLPQTLFCIALGCLALLATTQWWLPLVEIPKSWFE